MLSRVADNLFWMGRYLERSEHMARFLNIQYFSTIDLPYVQMREKAMLSILDMVGIVPGDESLIEEDILATVALDDNNPSSIISSVYLCRENARSVRDSISTEVWEAINNLYLFVSGYPVDIYKMRGLHDFTFNTINHNNIVKGKIYQTLINDVAFHFLQLGIHLERATQIVRIIISKMKDIQFLDNLKLGPSLELQQCNILLDCVEAKDMCRKYYNSLPNKHNALEFLLFVNIFPRSVIYNLNHAHAHLKLINSGRQETRGKIDYKVGKIINHLHYMEINDLDNNITGFLEETLKTIYNINSLIQEEYFIY
jgi:uncharacterized alpha-E superfamily protein